MSTAAQVRTVWNTNVFQHASIQAVTTKIYDREMRKDGLKSQLALLKQDQTINFIEYIATRHPDGGEIGSRRYLYTVAVNVYRELGKDSTGYTQALDTFEAIDARIIAGLGLTWSGTVDFASQEFDGPSTEEIEIEGKTVLQVSRLYRAEKYISS